MADKQPRHNSDEIDLGQLFQMIGKGVNSIFRSLLRIFLYFKKNMVILIGLAVIGAGIGYGLSKIVSKKLKIEVIVKPQMDSKNYLYDVIDEIQANLKNKDSVFFKSIGMELTNFEGLAVLINKVKPDEGDESDSKYLELLQSFENTEAISDIVRAELQNKTSFNHRITFLFKNPDIGKDFAEKIMKYINENEYFKGLITVYRTNATSRIEENKELLKQVDEIITNYSKNMGDSSASSGTDRIVLDNKETVNITGLFQLKNDLIQDIETKKIELENSTEVIKVINFGKSQPIQKPMFSRWIAALPMVLIGIFFIASLLTYLNKKAKAL